MKLSHTSQIDDSNMQQLIRVILYLVSLSAVTFEKGLIETFCLC